MTGEELQALRRSRRLQLNELADLLGMSRSTLHRYEQSDEVPPLVAAATCYHLGHTIIRVLEVDHSRKKVVNRYKPEPVMKKAGGSKLKASSAKVLTPFGESDQRPADWQGGHDEE